MLSYQPGPNRMQACLLDRHLVLLLSQNISNQSTFRWHETAEKDITITYTSYNDWFLYAGIEWVM
jgi:hypothetical protein